MDSEEWERARTEFAIKIGCHVAHVMVEVYNDTLNLVAACPGAKDLFHAIENRAMRQLNATYERMLE